MWKTHVVARFTAGAHEAEPGSAARARAPLGRRGTERGALQRAQGAQAELGRCSTGAPIRSHAGELLLDQPRGRSSGTGGGAGCLRASTPILSPPFLLGGHARSGCVFTLIRDGTSLRLARSSLLHLFFLLFSARNPPPPTELNRLRRPSQHWWAAPTSGNDADVLDYFRLQTTEEALLCNKREGSCGFQRRHNFPTPPRPPPESCMRSSRLGWLLGLSSVPRAARVPGSQRAPASPGSGILVNICTNWQAGAVGEGGAGCGRTQKGEFFRNWVLKKPREALLSFLPLKKVEFPLLPAAALAVTPNITLI